MKQNVRKKEEGEIERENGKVGEEEKKTRKKSNRVLKQHVGKLKIC